MKTDYMGTSMKNLAYRHSLTASPLMQLSQFKLTCQCCENPNTSPQFFSYYVTKAELFYLCLFIVSLNRFVYILSGKAMSFIPS